MRVLFVSLFVVLIDQITKLIIKGISIPFLKINFEGMNYGQSIEILGSFFKVTFVENPGMAFGIDLGNNSKLLLSVFSILASIGIVFYLFRVKEQGLPFRIALALILGGAIGNLIDRTFYGVIFDYAPLFYGKVVDFFNVDFFDFTLFGHTYERWPIFNIADIAVTIGVILLIFTQQKSSGEEKEESVENESNANSFWDPKDFRTTIDDDFEPENDKDSSSQNNEDDQNNRRETDSN